MRLHDIAPPRKYHDVELWTKEEFREYGTLYGNLHEWWYENGIPLAYWVDPNTDARFVIYLFEYDGYNEEETADEMGFGPNEYTTRGMNWYIDDQHNLEARP